MDTCRVTSRGLWTKRLAGADSRQGEGRRRGGAASLASLTGALQTAGYFQELCLSRTAKGRVVSEETDSRNRSSVRASWGVQLQSALWDRNHITVWGWRGGAACRVAGRRGAGRRGLELGGLCRSTEFATAPRNSLVGGENSENVRISRGLTLALESRR